MFNNYKAKCSIGKRGIGIKKKEGDLITPKGKYKIKYIMYRKDRIKKFESKIKKIIIKKDMGWCNDPGSKQYNKIKNQIRDIEKDLLNLTDQLSYLEIEKDLILSNKKIRGEEKKLKKSADLTLWEMWKNRPEEFENTMREMENKLLSEIETLEKVLSKLMKKLDEKTKSGWTI